MGINNAIQVIKQSNLGDIVTTIADAVMQSKMTDPILANLPMVGIAFSAYNSFNSIKDMVYLNNVQKYLSEIEDVPDTDRTNFVNKLEQDPKQFKRLCTNTVALLANFEDERKATLLGLITKWRIKRGLTQDQYLRLSSIILNVYIDDLKELKVYYKPMKSSSIKAHNLYLAGLLTQINTTNNAGQYLASGDTVETYIQNAYGSLLNKIIVSEKFYFS